MTLLPVGSHTRNVLGATMLLLPRSIQTIGF
ncbi:rCG21261 [Rattus norvegicus]|uniref:RCG21261 n=1 Tax=Rattus norvegicus TaxID=10116 RepID=A6J1L4_RAT|nr:rCG21261 [Rattus norvegicus]